METQIQFCSLCPLVETTTKPKSIKNVQVAEDIGNSFCSVLNLPAQEVIPLFSDKRTTAFCKECFQRVKELHKMVKDMDVLRVRLEEMKAQLEDNLREKIGGMGLDGGVFRPDGSIVNMVITYLPHLTVKQEIDNDELKPSDDDMDTSCNLLPHLVYNSDSDDNVDYSQQHRQREFKPEISATGIGRTTLESQHFRSSNSTTHAANNLIGGINQQESMDNDNSGRRRPKRGASSKAMEKMSTIMEMVENVEDPSKDKKKSFPSNTRKIPSRSCSTNVVLESTSTTTANETVCETGNSPKTKKRKTKVEEDEDYTVDADADGDNVQEYAEEGSKFKYARSINASNQVLKMTPSVIAEKKKILKMIADHPGWKLITIQRRGGAKFKNWSYKKKWEKQIAEFEEHLKAANEPICQRCVIGFKRIRFLRTHLLQFHPPRTNFICPVCELALSSQEDLSAHTILHKEPEDSSPTAAAEGAEFHCLQCNKTFSELHALRIHTWDHEFRKFKCSKSVCVKVFPKEEFFKKHKCHEPAKNFICDACGKSFRTTEYLRKHMLSHSDARTYQCHLCPKTVKYEFSFDRHMKQFHPGEPRGRAAAASRTTIPVPEGQPELPSEQSSFLENISISNLVDPGSQ